MAERWSCWLAACGIVAWAEGAAAEPQRPADPAAIAEESGRSSGARSGQATDWGKPASGRGNPASTLAPEAPVTARLGLATFPRVDVQMIEDSSRDDTVVEEMGLSSAVTATLPVTGWLDGGAHVQFDAGRAFRRVDPEAGGTTGPTQEVSGGFWEAWVALLVRVHGKHWFAEVGWAPFIARQDETRVDLPNRQGKTDGVFTGTPSVAYLGAVGGFVPVADRVDLSLRLQARIRYLVDRGGEPLLGDAELGNILVTPLVGLSYRFE